MLNGNTIELGVCYYPEHWDTSFWKEDMLRMKSYGIGVIRVAEFAWNLFEPEEGRFDDSFWDRFLNVAKDCGMQVIFCTPTATPPAWLTEKYPEVLNCDIYGHPVYHGMRKHHNMTSPVYLDFVKKIVEHIAAHYSAHPAIIGWQIDNEVNCETNSYHAPSDHEAFRKYLKEKYGTLENLNRAMGTTFWNQTYTDWEQVHLSRYTLANSNNPHMMLEEKRFISEAAINYIGIQADIIRKYRRSEQFITTNGLFGVFDNHKLVKEKLDFITYDSYPNFAFAMEGNKLSPRSLRDRETSFNLAKTRSVSNRFGIMEQQSGPGGWNTRLLQPAPKPGQLRLWTFQSIAHGADFVSYFRWRTCTFGTEMYWHGLLNYDNFPNRRTEELLRVSEDIQKIQRIAGTKHTAKFAILCDYDNEWDGMEDKWHGPLNWESTDGWFKALQRAHIPFEFVNINDEGTSRPLGNFTAAVYPHPTIMTPARAEILRAYAENGGTLFFGCRSGYKDIDGQCPMMPMPGLLAPLTGCTVEDFTFIGPADEKEYMTLGEKKIPAPTFNDILRPDFESCEVLATYDGNYYNGKPALTRNTVGKGTVYACGSVFAEETAAALLELLPKAELCPVTGWLERPEEIIGGAKFLAKMFGVDKVVIGVEDNKRNGIDAMNKVIAEQKAPVVVEPLRCRYPQGGEKQLCQAITGKQVPPGGLPANIGCAVFNINTTIAIYHAIKDGMPVVRKVVTVSGSGVVEPKNLECPIGTPVSLLFDACGGLKDETFKLIAGGPMMGMAQASADFPVAKGTGAVLAFAANENKVSEDPTCIRCGRCVEACPMHLEPLYLYLYVQKNRIEDLEAAHVMDCIECGACSYICPGRLHLTHSFKVGKQKVKEAAAKAKAAAEAAKAAEEAKKEA